MPSLDHIIIEHHIDKLPDAPPMCHMKLKMHPTKAIEIKAKVDKLHQDEFIFPIKYTSWVYNPVPVTKK